MVVVVTRRVRDAKFGKFVTKRSKYKAHSSDNGAHVGDKAVSYTHLVKRMGRFVGQRADWKKAIVTLEPGNKIEFFEGV